MVSVLAALALQVYRGPALCVVDRVKDLRGGGPLYAALATSVLRRGLSQDKSYDLVPETLQESIATIQEFRPRTNETDLFRLALHLRASVVVKSELIDAWVDAMPDGDQRGGATVRVVAYDAASELPVRGALEKGHSLVRSPFVDKTELVQEAIISAMRRAVEKTRALQMPSATIIETGPRTLKINQGSQAGFFVGQKLFLSRGPHMTGRAHVTNVSDDHAEVTTDGIIFSLAPGDRVRAVYVPPELPKAQR